MPVTAETRTLDGSILVGRMAAQPARWLPLAYEHEVWGGLRHPRAEVIGIPGWVW